MEICLDRGGIKVPGATKEEFYQTLDGAPYAARAFFEAVEAQFANRNSVFVHFTNTNGGDLRLVQSGNDKPINGIVYGGQRSYSLIILAMDVVTLEDLKYYKDPKLKLLMKN